MKELFLDGIIGTLLKAENNKELNEFLNKDDSTYLNIKINDNYILNILGFCNNQDYIDKLKIMAIKNVELYKKLEIIKNKTKIEEQDVINIIKDIKDIYLNINGLVIKNDEIELKVMNTIKAGMSNIAYKVQECLEYLYGKEFEVLYDVKFRDNILIRGTVIKGNLTINGLDMEIIRHLLYIPTNKEDKVLIGF